MCCRYVAASRNDVGACVARMLLLPTAPQSVATCRYQLLQRATPPGLRRSLPSTSVATAVPVLLPVQQARLGRPREKPRSGFRPKPVAAPTTLVPVLQCP